MSGGIPRPPLPSVFPRSYDEWRAQPSAEKCEALAALLQDYFAKYPDVTIYVRADRQATLTYVRSGGWGIAKMKLWQCGLPDDVQELIAHSIMLLE